MLALPAVVEDFKVQDALTPKVEMDISHQSREEDKYEKHLYDQKVQDD